MTENPYLINSEEHCSKQLMPILDCSLIILLKENHENPQSWQLLSWPTFESGRSGMWCGAEGRTTILRCLFRDPTKKASEISF
jgi:hypothetical protein